MKRQHDGDFYSGGGGGRGGDVRSKRVRADGEWEVRILIASKTAGAIIGKGGENIKRLRTEYSTGVNVPDSNTPERILYVSGDKENVCKCFEDIIPKLDEGVSSRGGRNRDREERPAGDSFELRVLIHQSQAGAVIGRAGFNIKELREQTKTEIKVFSECCPISTDRIVQISGNSSQCIDCLRRVMQICDDTPVKGATKPYDTMNYDPSYFQEYGGFEPDRSFRQNMGGGFGRGFGGVSPFGGSRGGRGGGGFDRFGSGSAFESFDSASPFGGGGRGGMRGNMGGRGRGGSSSGGFGGPSSDAFGGGAFDAGADMGGPVETTQVTIPKDLAGTIIGKGGERINSIRQSSGASITVDPPQQGNPERIITISGTQYQIKNAQYMLQQCVRSSAAGRQYIHDQEQLQQNSGAM